MMGTVQGNGKQLGSRLAAAQRLVYGQDVPPLIETAMGGQASSRLYYRYELLGDNPQLSPGRFVVMVLPADALRSDEGGGGEPLPSELPFLNVQRYMRARGLPVPEVYGADLAQGVVALQDLGDTMFEQHIERLGEVERAEAYRGAVDLLVEMQRRCSEDDEAAPDCVAYQRRFDRELLRWELDHFVEWGLEALGEPLSAAERLVVERAFDPLVDELLALPQGFVHRDYQSRNLMVDDTGALYLIDFQDALVGPYTYDLAALLCDSYVALSAELQLELVDRYAAATGRDVEANRRAFWAIAAQRKLKDTGRFVFIDRVRGNPSFLRHVPQSFRYVDRALAALGLEDLRALIAVRVPGYPDGVAVPAAVSHEGSGT